MENPLSEAKGREEYYGHFEMSPKTVTAGDPATVILTYHVGKYGIDDGGSLLVSFRDVSDIGFPQTDSPELANYVTASTTGSARISVRYDPKGHVRPWTRGIVLDVYGGYLAEGDVITCIIGDVSKRSPGYLMQSFCEKQFKFKILVDCFGTGRYVELENNYPIEIKSGKPAKIVTILPSKVKKGQNFSITLKVEDRWGNVCQECDTVVTLKKPKELEGLPDSFDFGGAVGLKKFENLEVKSPGVFDVVGENDNLKNESNPSLCIESDEEYKMYWGDLQGQSEETVGTNPIESYYRHARQVSALDFVGHQGNDFQITEKVWKKITDVINDNYEPQSFVTLVGYEWSGNTGSGGDRNVFYLNKEGDLLHSSYWLVNGDDKDKEYAHVNELFAALRGKDALIIPHVGGRYANLTYHDPEIEPLIEICSDWGHFEWFIQDALSNKYRIGFTGGSDGHSGRPGSSYPGREFAVRGGLTCVLARDLTREGIWEGLRSRRCYATSGQRIILNFDVDGHLMGEECRVSKPPKISASVTGTSPIKKMELKRGLETIFEWTPDYEPDESDTFTVTWSGSVTRGRERKANWDGEIELEDASIVEAREHIFEIPEAGITYQDKTRVQWISSTAGNENGIVLKLASGTNPILHFRTNISTFSLPIKSLSREEIIDAGGLDLQVRIERMNRLTAPKTASFQYVDKDIGAGLNQYYVRVVQEDGQKAWSSPVHVDYGNP